MESLHKELVRLEQQGDTVVSIDELFRYVSQRQARKLTDNDLLVAKINGQNQSMIEEYKEERAEWRELFKAVISNGQAANKMLATINGGGALALLAFIGKVWSLNFPDSTLGYNITISLLLMCIGLGLSALTQAFGYFAQHYFTYENNDLGRFFQIGATSVGLFSLFLFFGGVVFACRGFGLF